MSDYYGDILLGSTIDIKFTTRQISGAPFTLAGTPVISAYPGNSTGQITAGITLTVDFDSVTGYNNVRVVATGANGFAAATDYDLCITTGTVNGVSVVGESIGSFSIENRSGLMRGTNNPGTTTIAALTVTGALTVADGVLIARSTPNTDALVISGNGTGNGIVVTGEIGLKITAVGDAILAASIGGGDGYGLHVLGSNAGGGVRAEGGPTGNGIEALGGGFGGNGILTLAEPLSGGIGFWTIGSQASPGFKAEGGNTGDGAFFVGGAFNGSGLRAVGAGGSGAGDGITATGFGGGVDIWGNLEGTVISLTTAGNNLAADALLNRNIAGGSSAGRLVKEALYQLRNRWVVAAGVMTVYAPDDVTISWTSVIASDAAAVPIVGSDPA